MTSIGLSGSKRVRIADSQDGSSDKTRKRCIGEVDSIFTEFPDKLIKRIANICEHYLCCPGDYNELILRSLQFSNCNGADENGGVPFSEAYCSVKPNKGKSQVLGSVFMTGLDMLLQFLVKRRIPDSFHERLVLGKLLHYLVDTEIQAPLQNLEEFSETDLSIVLANHLFGQLATSSRYVINKNSTGKTKKCPCSPECGMPCCYGDTSIGNEGVWHGDVDVIINQDVVINTVDDESSPGETPAKVRPSRNPQIIAQTVVFSFLQNQCRPESMNSLFPCIRVTSDGLVIYFYDSVHDVLLESSRIPLHIPGKEAPYNNISLTAILVSWLTVNYRYLCSGLPESLLSTENAGFFSQAGDKLQVYRNNLKSGNVEGPSLVCEDSDSDVETPGFLTEIRSKFYNIARRTKSGRDSSFVDNS